MVEGARLERVYTGNRIEGSNPSLTAILQKRMNKACCELDMTSFLCVRNRLQLKSIDFKTDDAR